MRVVSEQLLLHQFPRNHPGTVQAANLVDPAVQIYDRHAAGALVQSVYVLGDQQIHMTEMLQPG